MITIHIPIFVKGLILGISMAAPIGPISILCMRRSLTQGYPAGIATALGVALADGLYGLVAALGLTAISSFLIDKKEFLYLFGGILLIFLGIKTLNAMPVASAKPIKRQGLLTMLLQTIFLTFANPMTIALFIAALAALGFEGKHEDIGQAILVCSGVFFGSLAWFMMLSTIIVQFRSKVSPHILMLINKISGMFLVGFGSLFLLNVIRTLVAYFIH